MSQDRDLEIKLKLYEDFLKEGHSEQEAAELAEKAWQRLNEQG